MVATIKILNGFKRLNYRDSQRRIAISNFSIVLLILGFFFWSYYLLTVIQSSNCEFAANWISGWFDFGSPLQLFAISFSLSLVIWVFNVVTRSRENNVVESIVQGIFIAAFFISLGFVKAIVLPHSIPNFRQAMIVAEFVNPSIVQLEEEVDTIPPVNRPPWPYDFPTPPSYPYWRSWLAGYNPDLGEIFTSTNAPTFWEYNQMIQCAARYKARVRDRERAIDEFDQWHESYGWQVESKYYHYKWD